MDVVPYVLHEVLVYVSGLVDHPPFLAENVDRDDRKDEEDYHQPSALRRHADK